MLLHWLLALPWMAWMVNGNSNQYSPYFMYITRCMIKGNKTMGLSWNILKRTDYVQESEDVELGNEYNHKILYKILFLN